MALGGQTRAAFAVQPLQLEIAIVEGVHKMRRRAARLATGDGAVFDHDHALSGAGEQVGGGEAGDAGADDAYVGATIRSERAADGDSDSHPDRRGLAPSGSIGTSGDSA